MMAGNLAMRDIRVRGRRCAHDIPEETIGVLRELD